MLTDRWMNQHCTHQCNRLVGYTQPAQQQFLTGMVPPTASSVAVVSFTSICTKENNNRSIYQAMSNTISVFQTTYIVKLCVIGMEFHLNYWGRFHEKSQIEPDSRLSQGLKSETFVSAEFLAQMDFTKGGSAETSFK